MAMRKITCLCVHHTATPSGDVDQFRRAHRARGWSDVGYHAIILRDGSIQQGRPDEKIGAAVYGANTGLLHVALVGQFDRPSPGFTGPPTLAQLTALGDWLLARNWKYATSRARPPLEVAGHKEKALPSHPTACPGSEFPLAAVRRWFDYFAPIWRPGDVPSLPLGEFVSRGDALSLIDDVHRLMEPKKRRLRVAHASGREVEIPRDDWQVRSGQTWVRLRALCDAAGLMVHVKEDAVVVEVGN